MSSESPAMTSVWLGLGSNQSNPAAQLQTAIHWLRSQPSLVVRQISSIYKSPAMQLPGQNAVLPDYLNIVVALDCELSAQQLLAALKQQEQRQGRDLGAERWSSRCLDMDILMFGQALIQTESLTVPHIGIAERDFVLLPWCEISPNTRIPQLSTVADCAQQLGRVTAIKIAQSLDEL